MQVRISVEWTGDLPEDMIQHFQDNVEEAAFFVTNSECTLRIFDVAEKKYLASIRGDRHEQEG